MSTYESDVDLEDIVVRDTAISSAVDEPVRAMILDMLAEQELTIDDIHEELVKRGFDRTVNTVRHHVNELRDAGLVEVGRLEERRGGTLKYYRANTIVLSYALPDGYKEDVQVLSAWMGDRLEPIIDEFLDKYQPTIEELADQMAPCEHCAEQKYETYLLLTILRRGFVNAYQHS